MEYAMTDSNGFEIQTCSRCGGTGEYSFNLMYGTVCFKCGGRKTVYTGRGAAARKHYNSLLTIPVEQLKVGMYVWVEAYMLKSHWGEVKEINGDEVVTPRLTFVRQAMFRIKPTEEQRVDALTAALEYQDTLTKPGKVRKNAKV